MSQVGNAISHLASGIPKNAIIHHMGMGCLRSTRPSARA